MDQKFKKKKKKGLTILINIHIHTFKNQKRSWKMVVDDYADHLAVAA